MAQEIGSAKAIQGHVTAAGPGGNRDLHTDSPVFKGDVISTAKAAAGSIQFLDHTVLNVGEGSKVSLDQYVYDASKGTGHVLFKLAQGTFRTVTGEIVKHNPESFKMQSPLATIGIRGTETAHVVPTQGEGSESHLVMVFDGKPVIVQPLGGGAYQVLSQAGVKVEVGQFGAGPVVVMTPQEYKYFQSLTATGVQQGAPTDDLTPKTRDEKAQDAQNAANKATADAQAKAAAEAAAKAAAAAAAQAAALAAASGDPAAKAAADAAAKAAADAAAKAAAEAKAAADAAAKAQADAVAAQQALALADAASKAAADAAAKAAADAALQNTQNLTLDLNAGSILNLSGSLGSGTITITVTGPGGTTTTTTVQVLLSQQAQEAVNSATGHETTTIPTTTTINITPDNSMDFSASLLPVHVDLSEHDYYFGPSPMNLFSLSPNIINISGTSYDDTIIGSSAANALSGGDGNDSITAGEGNNSISGGDGNDTIMAGDGNNSISGGDGNDHIDVGNGNNYISAGPGDDYIVTGNGNNIIDTGTGHDSVHTGSGNDAIFVGTDLTADDTIDGGAGTDTLYFTDNGQGTDELANVKGIEKIILGDATTNIAFPNDGTFSQTDWADIGGVLTVDGRALSATHTLTFDGSQAVHGAFNIMGGAGDDTLTGGHGDDTIEGMGGNDVLDGGQGTNTVSYAHASAGVTVDLNVSTAQNTGGAGTDTLANFQNIIGSAYADHLTAASTGSVMTGGGGADTLVGSASADTFVYTTQSDVVAGETITADSMDTVKITGSVDFRAAPGITDFGTIKVEGDGLAVTFSRAQLYEQDTVTFVHSESAPAADTISVYLDTTNNSVDATTANITGNIAGDTLRFFGSTGADTIIGSGLGDIISGGAGADSLDGGAGNDTLIGGAGADTIHGGAGTDVLDYSLETGTNAISFDTVPGGIFDTHGDRDTVGGIEVLKLNDATTSLSPTDATISGLVDGGATSLTIDGSALTSAHTLTVHGDSVTGGYNLALTGGAGADTLLGGAGNDTLTGGAGADSLNGGAGNDTYVFNAGNVVTGEHLTDTAGTTTMIINGAVDLSKDTIALDPGTMANQLTHVLVVEGGSTVTLGPSQSLSMGLGNYADLGIISEGNNATVVLQGTTGTDIFSLEHLSFDSFTGTVSIVGGGGSDTLDLSSSVDGMHVDVAAGSLTDLTTPMSAQVVFNGIAGFLLGNGNDVFEGGSGAENVFSGNGNDSLIGNGGNDTLLAGNGNDTFYGGAGADMMQGGTGANVFVFNPGDVGTGEMVISSGSGTLETHGDVDFTSLTALAIGSAKTLDMHATDATVTMNAAQLTGQTWAVAANDTHETLLLNGTTGADSIDLTHFTASGSPTIEIDGKAGADTIDATGLAASLVLNGGAGADTMTGGTHDTTFVFHTGDVSSNEHINIIDNAGSASSTFDIQTSTDFTAGSVAVLNDAGAASTHAATLFLNLGAGTTATFLASQLAGSGDNLEVILSGNSQGSTTETLVIKDTDAGGTLNGGGIAASSDWAAGEDVIRFEGGAGQDTLSYASLRDDNGQAAVAPNLLITAGATAGSGTVDYTMTIHGDMDMYLPVEHVYTGIESLVGGLGNDTFIGGSYANAFNGGAGNDSITGGAGNDTFDGGYGDDTLIGGGGADYLFGNAGTNTYIFNTGDAAAGETLEFANDSTNIVQVNSTTDFSNLDHIWYDGDNVTTSLVLNGAGVGATFNAADLVHPSGMTWEVIGAAGVQTLTLNGTSGDDTIDLSHLTFSNWTAGEDLLTINGHEGSDAITGSSANDIIIGGDGADTINGGAGTDTLDYFQEGGAQAISITNTATPIGSDIFREITDTHGNTDLVTGIEKIVLNDADYSGTNAIALGNANLAYLVDTGATTFTLDGSHLTGTHALYADASEATHYNLALLGGAGNDSLVGASGNDTLSGGAGNDTLNGSGGSNTLDYSHETGGAAIHIATDGQSITDSYGATDTIGDGTYGHVNTIILNDADYTGANAITLHETMLNGLADPDVTTFTLDGSHLTAGHGLTVDASDAGMFTLSLTGGAGDDHFSVMPISDIPTEHFNGGAGTDTLDYSHYTGGTVFFDTSDAIIHCGWDGSGANDGDDYVTGMEKVVLSEGDYSGTHALTITDGFMNAMFGADTAAAFTVDASHFVTSYGVAIDGSALSAGHDLVFVSGPGDDTITGGESGGHTIVSYESATDNLDITLNAYDTVHFEAYPCGADTLNFVNGVITGSGDDTIHVVDGGDYYLDGGAGNDTITGGDGADMLFGHAGTNELYGMGGDDTLFGGQGDNTMDGGDGSNTVSYTGAEYAVTVNLADGYAHVWNGTANIHTDILTSIQNITGSSHNDFLFGDTHDNVIDGGAGNDTLMGGGGADTLTGGDGADVFHFKTDSATVEITDFTHGTDKIQINTGSGSDFSAMNSSWAFNTVNGGLNSHSGTSATATLTYDTLDHTLYYDADGTGTASSAVAVAHFSNAATVTQADILTTTITPTGH